MPHPPNDDLACGVYTFERFPHYKGPIGASGPPGTRGNDGQRGPQGAPGLPGATGPQGDKAKRGVCAMSPSYCLSRS